MKGDNTKKNFQEAKWNSYNEIFIKVFTYSMLFLNFLSTAQGNGRCKKYSYWNYFLEL